ncbi:MAG: hypothetical protein ACTTKD_07420 [Peptoanaerobacter stomatis]|uniref:hypothetical protein n=1 Tax=Peptoanaerobacter stomatis TaxID=796937 RepID=UPI003FA10CAF
MATLKCRQCNEMYSSCSDALTDKDYKSFCCSEDCYKKYISIVLAERAKTMANMNTKTDKNANDKSDKKTDINKDVKKK